ncbi:MAG: tRNA (guanosine(37)-N1)-methyltransferase TrmD [Acidobacteria bacterium]|nr:tRNA (guanosine(37)-N1)-methyltransferase TrmD [Acidobacteriota bacterium]
MFDAIMDEGIVAKAAGNGILEIAVHDLRDHAPDKHRSTDDEAYGGGAGMVMLAEPVFRCLDHIRALPGREAGRPWVVEMSPQGRPFDQAAAVEFAGRDWTVILCGRYEGFDQRVRDAVVDEEISIGDFVVTGGELPAMMVIDAVSRMIDGVVGKRNSVEADSFYEGLLDYPHYTRPAEVRGAKVPEVLLSGHFEKIRRWRKEQSLLATLRKRPDLLRTAHLDDEARTILDALRKAEGDGEGANPLPRERK